MSNTTPSLPPSASPNLTHHPYSIATGLNAVGILCTVLTTCTTAIRFYTKLYIIKAHGWEDCEYYSYIPSYVFLRRKTVILSDRCC